MLQNPKIMQKTINIAKLIKILNGKNKQISQSKSSKNWTAKCRTSSPWEIESIEKNAFGKGSKIVSRKPQIRKRSLKRNRF